MIVVTLYAEYAEKYAEYAKKYAEYAEYTQNTENYRPYFEEDCHNSAGIEIQAEVS